MLEQRASADAESGDCEGEKERERNSVVYFSCESFFIPACNEWSGKLEEKGELYPGVVGGEKFS